MLTTARINLKVEKRKNTEPPCVGLLERDTAGVAAGLEMFCAVSVGLDSPQNYLQIVSPPPPTSIRLPRASCRPRGNSADISTF